MHPSSGTYGGASSLWCIASRPSDTCQPPCVSISLESDWTICLARLRTVDDKWEHSVRHINSVPGIVVYCAVIGVSEEDCLVTDGPMIARRLISSIVDVCLFVFMNMCRGKYFIYLNVSGLFRGIPFWLIALSCFYCQFNLYKFQNSPAMFSFTWSRSWTLQAVIAQH